MASDFSLEGSGHAAPWPAPAKVNLLLRITGRRADGYHDLQTVFQLLDFGDEIRFGLREDGEVSRVSSMADLPPDRDLVVRAARSLQEVCGSPRGVDIRVSKRIPAGGGLGGGSSDAATTLVALNQIWECGLPPPDLAALGRRLGADVPVFVNGRSAWAEGVGDRLTALDLPLRWYLVVDPRVMVPTAQMFRAPGLTRNSAPIKISDFFSGVRENAFEPVVRAQYPEIAAALDWLDGHREQTRPMLTGSGGCVFLTFSSSTAAHRVRSRLPVSWGAFVARGVGESPLMARLRVALRGTTL